MQMQNLLLPHVYVLQMVLYMDSDYSGSMLNTLSSIKKGKMLHDDHIKWSCLKMDFVFI